MTAGFPASLEAAGLGAGADGTASDDGGGGSNRGDGVEAVANAAGGVGARGAGDGWAGGVGAVNSVEADESAREDGGWLGATGAGEAGGTGSSGGGAAPAELAGAEEGGPEAKAARASFMASSSVAGAAGGLAGAVVAANGGEALGLEGTAPPKVQDAREPARSNSVIPTTPAPGRTNRHIARLPTHACVDKRLSRAGQSGPCLPSHDAVT